MIVTGRGLGKWREAGERDLRKREQALSAFIGGSKEPREKPRRRRKTKFKPAIYETGNCLAIKLPNEEYGAALVLAADNGQKLEGKNLVGVLRYKSPEKPGLDVFEKQEWLVLNHHEWGNVKALYWCFASLYRKEAASLELVGRIALNETDLKDAGLYSGWNVLGEQITLQYEWESKETRRA